MNFSNNKKNTETVMSYKLAFQIILFVFSIVVFLSLISSGALFGVAGKAINSFILGVFGHLAYPLFIASIFITIKLFTGKKITAKKGSFCAIVMFFAAALCYHQLTGKSIFSTAEGFGNYLQHCFNKGSGGIFNSTGGGVLLGLIVYPVTALFGVVGSYIIFCLIFGIALATLFYGNGYNISNVYSRKSNNYDEINGVKEYPTGFFSDTQNNNPSKNYVLPNFQTEDKNRVLGSEIPLKSTAIAQPEPDLDDTVQEVPKKLFVGFIDDFVNTKPKKQNTKSRSFDILYSAPKSKVEEAPYTRPSSNFSVAEKDIENTVSAKKLGGTNYVDTFGDDIESKKKYILTPVDNILRPESDYGFNSSNKGAFPLNLGGFDKPATPTRINHSISQGVTGNGGLSSYNENNSLTDSNHSKFEKYANQNYDSGLSDKVSAKDIKDNIKYNPSGLRDRFSNIANEKSNDSISNNVFGSEKTNDSIAPYKKTLPNLSLKKYSDSYSDNITGGIVNGSEKDNSFLDNLSTNKSTDNLTRSFKSDNIFIPQTGFEKETNLPINLGFNADEDNFDTDTQNDNFSISSEDNFEEDNQDILKNPYLNKPVDTALPTYKKPAEILQQTNTINQDKPIISSPYIAPPTALMSDIFFDLNEVAEDYDAKVKALEETLEQFKVPAKVMSVTPGPTVTRYELQMPPGVPVSKLTSRANDIAMCLASNGEIRIEAPIPGKSLLGIELPNKKRAKVGLKEVIESVEFSGSKSPVAFALGKDITGKNVIVDFTKMPHLLVAGSTGSGKSVCLNTLIISIIYKAAPEDVKLILIDPKRVEFNVYNGLPHLMLKDVITDAEKAISAFNWAINEMDRRFELFKNTGAKDIISYNEKVKISGEQKLPRIMIIVDELAELMMIHKRELEEKIKKISQLSRAAGIHLILATQRPSVDIITGVIKANLSSRVTFKLMTQADSRTILDSAGAEKLLGEGDMIFLTTSMPKPVRLQGPFISMNEVESIVEFIKENNESYFDEAISDKILKPSSGEEDVSVEDSNLEEQDKYFVDALRLAVDSGQISISMVQRKFAVGYSRAGKIIDEMESQNFITPFEGSKPRQVLISREEFERRFG